MTDERRYELKMLGAGAYGPAAWAFRVHLLPHRNPIGVVYQEGPLAWRARIRRPVRRPGQAREWRDPRRFPDREQAARAAVALWDELCAAAQAAEQARNAAAGREGA